MSGSSGDKEAKKLAYFLPNTFTALNMGCGFFSIVLSWKGDFYYACMLLLLGAIFDSVDGRIARLTGTQSTFGEQFDSISDVISFGIAPALLVYNRFFVDLDKLGIMISFVYCLCGALRLARFNANIDKISSTYFQGLPIPASALALVGYVLLTIEFPVVKNWTPVAVVYVLSYGVLMITNIPFYSFKQSDWVEKHKKLFLAIIFVLLILVFAYVQIMMALIMATYVICSLIYFFRHKNEMDNIFQWQNDEE